MNSMLNSNLPETSRIWVYQSDSDFSSHQKLIIAMLDDFISTWSAHGVKLEADYKLFYGRFIVMAVNEAVQRATGCSIDKSVQLINSIQVKTNIDFFNRTIILYKDDLHQIQETDLSTFADLYKAGTISENTVVFNNLVSTISEFNRSWETSVLDSWHANLIRTNSIV